MKKLFIIVLLVLLFGCDQLASTKYSELKSETAEVVSLNYIPRNSDVSFSPGMSTSGDFVFSMSEHVYPETWVVILRCSEHNKTFGIKNKLLFESVKIDDIVVLKYVDEIQYFPYAKSGIHAGLETVIDQHTKQIDVNGSIINRD